MDRGRAESCNPPFSTKYTFVFVSVQGNYDEQGISKDLLAYQQKSNDDDVWRVQSQFT